MPLRVDSPGSTTGAYKELPNGWIQTIGYPTKAGILEYRTVDGDVVREFRPPEEMFSQETMDSFKMLPLTLEHPPVYKLDSDNIDEYQIGHLGDSCHREDDKLAVPIAITSRKGVEAARAGITELSAVYVCELDNTPGIWQGQPYDRIQRKVRGNSVALTQKGRAGAECSIRLDSAGELLPAEKQVEEKKVEVKNVITTTPTEVPQVRLDSLLGMLDAERLAHQQAKQEIIVLKQKIEKLETVREDSISKEGLEAKIKERLEIIEQAKEISPDFRYDSTKGSVKDIQIQAIAAAQPEFAKKLSEKSEEYVSGVFEALKASRADSPSVRLEVSGDHFFSRSDVTKGIEEERDYNKEFFEAAEAARKGTK